MFVFQNMRKIIIVVFLIAIVPTLSMADGKYRCRTRVNVGAYTDNLSLIVHYINPSSVPITIKEIKVFRPDGTEVFPNFSADSFPVPPFDLGPFESKGFALKATGVQPVALVPRGVFQVHAYWKTKRATSGLNS